MTFRLTQDKCRSAGPWVLYDGTCTVCTAGAMRLGQILRRRGFRLETLQSDVGQSFVADRIDEMKVVTHRGEVMGGPAAIAHICRHIWWAQPLAALWALPPLQAPLRGLYSWIAAHRTCNYGEHLHRGKRGDG